MKAKEEKIREAWHVHYTSDIDENGYRLYPEFGEHFLYQWVDRDFDKGFNKITNKWWVRPKSLQGIENNNGWIKIESEDDLPKTRGDNDVFIVDFNGDITVGCSKLLAIKEIRSYWRATITHYQPIQKPQPPIY